MSNRIRMAATKGFAGLIVISCAVFCACGQTVLTADGLVAFRKTAPPSGGGGGGGGTYSMVAHSSANVASTGTATTPGIDTTGAKLIVLAVTWFSGHETVSDNKGNTYAPLTPHGDSSGIESNRLYYCVNPTVGSGHTFSASATSSGYVVLNAAAFSLSSGTPAFDAQNGFNRASGNTTAYQAGSLTPAGNNELLVTSFTWNNDGVTATGVDSSFSILNQSEQGANGISGGLADLIQTTATTVNPTWTFSANVNACSGSIAAFK